MKRLGFCLLIALACGCATAPGPVPATQSAQALDKSVTRRVKLHYLMYLPPDYPRDAQHRWPLVIFLHGKGERGNDLEKVKLHGPPMMVAQGRQFPFVLVSPQCPATRRRWNTDDLDVLLDDLLTRYRIDADRVYVTGLSMGGYGTWQWISRRPERFAAAVPVCGGGDRANFDDVKLPPVWAFHGDADNVVEPVESQRMVKRWQLDGGEAKLTLYPGVKHDSWKKAYADEAMWDWMLSKKRGEP